MQGNASETDQWVYIYLVVVSLRPRRIAHQDMSRHTGRAFLDSTKAKVRSTRLLRPCMLIAAISDHAQIYIRLFPSAAHAIKVKSLIIAVCTIAATAIAILNLASETEKA